MSSNPSAVSSKDVLYLALDDAAVTFGGQFREVALGLLITQLNPAASSYGWYFLVGSIPGILLVRWYGWASRVWPPRRVLILSYLGRILLVLALWRVQSFWEALGCLFGIAAGSGLYSTSQAHYIAHENDLPATRRVVIRLRQAASALMMVGPVAAGLVLTALGFRAGFLLSALFYGVAAPRRGARRPPGQPSRREPLAHRSGGDVVFGGELPDLSSQRLGYCLHVSSTTSAVVRLWDHVSGMGRRRFYVQCGTAAHSFPPAMAVGRPDVPGSRLMLGRIGPWRQFLAVRGDFRVRGHGYLGHPRPHRGTRVG